jgi:hypothetical protein
MGKAQTIENSLSNLTVTSPTNVGPFPVDSNDIQGRFLLANQFQIRAVRFRVAYKYTLSFQRETEEARRTREARRPRDQLARIGNFTYVSTNSPAAKKKRTVRQLFEALAQANIEVPILTDYSDQIISAKRLKGIPGQHVINCTEWAENVIYRDEYESQTSANSEIFRVTISGPLALSFVLI